MYLGQVQDDGSIEVIDTYPNTPPGDQCPALQK
jgi:hypothetical protein